MFPHKLSHNGVVWEIGGERPERFNRMDDVIIAAQTKAPRYTDAFWDNLTCGLYLGWIEPYQSEGDAAIARASQQQRNTRQIERGKQADSWREEMYGIKPNQRERVKWWKVLR